MGFGPRTTTDDVLAGVGLEGSVVVVTGASSGLGTETARSLAAHGARVAMAVRNPTASVGARDTVGPNAELVALDLASLASVRAGAAEILARWPRVDVLINNAGVMATPEGRTAEGFEMQIGTNHLGHFLLTVLLAPALGESSRIVNVTSLGHMISAIHWDDPHYRTRAYDKWEAYGQSKTANILFTRGLAARGRTAYAAHPGKVGTDLYRHLDDAELAGSGASSREDGTKTIPEGAATAVWAATAAGIPSGSYLADCQVAEAAAHAVDPMQVDRLWAWSEEQVGQQTFS
jgi:NAD(P)-dependent dehydrogenase (short-subunit alcohol dehydrogenase family)